MLIPETYVSNNIYWYTNNTDNVSYIESTMHTIELPSISNNLKNILGSHLINRRVLLSNNSSDTKLVGSTGYTWTTAYATLPSVGQLTGNFAQHNNKYDDGEANYKLPLFNFMNYYDNNSDYWTRNVRGCYEVGYYGQTVQSLWKIDSNGINITNPNNSNIQTRPLIYIR